MKDLQSNVPKYTAVSQYNLTSHRRQSQEHRIDCDPMLMLANQRQLFGIRVETYCASRVLEGHGVVCMCVRKSGKDGELDGHMCILRYGVCKFMSMLTFVSEDG